MKRIIAGLTLILAGGIAHPQEEDRLLVAEIKQSTVITEPATLIKGFFKLGAILTYTADDKLFTENWKKDYEPENGSGKYSTEYLHFHYGLTNRIELAIALPFVIKSMTCSIIDETPVNDSTMRTQYKSTGRGLGDIEFGIYYQLLEGSKTKPSLVSKLSMTFPTGKKNPTNIREILEYNYPTGKGETSVYLELIYRKITYPYSYSFYGLFQYSFGGEKIMLPYENPISFRSGNLYQAGGNFNFLLNDWIAVQNDLLLIYRQSDEYKGETAMASFSQTGICYNPNISFQFKKFRLAQGVFIPLFGRYFPANPQYNIDLQYIF
ncbi:MAG: hypothetical protein R6W81_14415 [Bacteroidales bacterium]